MTSTHAATRRERLELAGDGALITAATLAVLISIVLLATAAFEDREVPLAIQFASAAATFLGIFGGPVIAWLMHRRRASPAAILGALAGVPVAWGIFWVFVGFAQLIGWVLSPISDADWVGPLVAVAIVAADFVGLVVWLVLDAVRDARGDRAHRSLDRTRMFSAAIVAVYSSVIVVLAIGELGGEILEAVGFTLLGALAGASVVTCADLATRLAGRMSDEPTATSA